MKTRMELHNSLKAILGNDHVYFQPPASVRMVYPAIVYGIEHIDITHANNGPYLTDLAYNVTVIDKNPESKYVMAVSKLPKCKFNRHYVVDNLHHNTFTIYF